MRMLRGRWWAVDKEKRGEKTPSFFIRQTWGKNREKQGKQSIFLSQEARLLTTLADFIKIGPHSDERKPLRNATLTTEE